MPIVNTRKPPPQTFAGRLPKTTFEVMGAIDGDETTHHARIVYGYDQVVPPKSVPTEDLLAMAQCARYPFDVAAPSKRRVRSPLTAIRAICIDCAGGVAAVRECGVTCCPLWAFRMGNNPFFGKVHEASDNTGDE